MIEHGEGADAVPVEKTTDLPPLMIVGEDVVAPPGQDDHRRTRPAVSLRKGMNDESRVGDEGPSLDVVFPLFHLLGRIARHPIPRHSLRPEANLTDRLGGAYDFGSDTADRGYEDRHHHGRQSLVHGTARS